MWRNRSILLCRGDMTVDGNVDRIGRDILDGFRDNGWSAFEVVIPLVDPGPALFDAVARLERGAYDLVLSVQDMGMFGGSEINAIVTRGGARRLYWALDHPYSCWQTVARLPANTVLTYPTRGNLDCCRQYLRADIAPLCVAHGAAPRKATPWAGRDVATLFVGNAPAIAPEQMRRDWSQRYPAAWAALLDEMALRFDPARSEWLDGLAAEALAARATESTAITRDDFMLLLSVFDVYARARIRLAYVEALRGLPITLIGRGWEAFADGETKVLGPLSAEHVRAMTDRARLVLNILPAWYRSHERVFEGMAAGCAVATTGRDIIANASGQDHDTADDFAIAALGPPDEARDRIADLLDDENGLQTLAEAGLAEQRAHHTWAHRVEALLAAVEAASMSGV